MNENLLRFRKGIRYVFIDCETYNLNLHFKQNRPWQIGVIEYMDGKILSSHDIWILWDDCPHLEVGVEAARITRYSKTDHLARGIHPKKAFEIFWPLLEQADFIVMHNGLKFDLYLLKGYAEYMGVSYKFLVNKIIDSKAIAQGMKLGQPFNPKKESFFEYNYKMSNSFARGIKTRLELLGKEFNIPHDYERLHDAICDLELNIKVFEELIRRVDLPVPESPN